MTFPLLSKLARKILCIPATSAPSERTFSTAGNIATAKRNRIAPELLEQIVFLNESWDCVEGEFNKRE